MFRRTKSRPWAWGILAALIGLIATGAAQAEPLSGQALAAALRQGGYVLVMRHASSPQSPPSAAEAGPDNPNRERQLDEAGRKAAGAMGAAIKALRIPVGEVWSSPAYRALQTARLLGAPDPKTAVELGDNGRSMQAVGADQPAWLKARAAEPPRPGTDTLIVTHYPNLLAAFGQGVADITDGEALIFHPTEKGRLDLVGRIPIEAWPALAAR